MTVPLFDVKNKLSEYVLIAQNEEPVRISKHGKDAAVLINVEEYDNYVHQKSSAFYASLEKWLDENPSTEENTVNVEEAFETFRNRPFVSRENPFTCNEDEN